MAVAVAPEAVSVENRVARHSRNHYLDLVRLLLAVLVLLSHAPELRDGDQHREIFHRLTGTGATFGSLAVVGFFLLSGSLIVQSWLGNPNLMDFLRKRVLRIVPGYLVAVVLSIGVCGVVAGAGGPRAFFSHYTRHEFFTSIIKLSSPISPHIFENTPFPLANGAMYTIHYEFICYCLVAAFGVVGLLRRPRWWLLTSVVALSLYLLISTTSPSSLVARLDRIDQFPVYLPLVAAFFAGGSFYLARQWVPFSPWIALAAVGLFVVCKFLCPQFIGTAIILGSGYLLQYLALLRLPTPGWLLRWPDISYGTYLYGWPTEKLWLWYRPADSPWLVFFACTCICLGLGALSWHFVEKPMLKLRRGGTSPKARVPFAYKDDLPISDRAAVLRLRWLAQWRPDGPHLSQAHTGGERSGTANGQVTLG